MRLNLTDIEVRDFSAVPTNTYKVRIEDGEVRDTKDGATDKNPSGQYINWTLEIVGGDYDGRKVWKSTPLGGNGLSFLKELLTASGRYDESDMADLDTDVIIDGCLGAEMIASVSRVKKKGADGNVDEDYTNNVNKLRPLSEEEVTSLLP